MLRHTCRVGFEALNLRLHHVRFERESKREQAVCELWHGTLLGRG